MATKDPIAVPPRVNDLTGQTFGRWTVLRYAGQGNRRNTKWVCVCQCGAIRTVEGGNICSGASRSCGCLQRDTVVATHTTHGLCGAPEYGVWKAMRKRCRNIADPSYYRYGGRGISVCERWASFEAFYEDMGPRPSDGHSIDRIDNSGRYEPANCRWATGIEQGRNTRKNRLLSHNGKTMCVSAWSEEIGVSTTALHARLSRGWSIERTLSTPVTH